MFNLIIFSVGFCDHEENEADEKQKQDVDENSGPNIVSVVNKREIAFEIHDSALVG